jgi:hypothetical protein
VLSRTMPWADTIVRPLPFGEPSAYNSPTVALTVAVLIYLVGLVLVRRGPKEAGHVTDAHDRPVGNHA